ncbi:MAG: hypothetical protein RLN75_08725 [Longimicrobiales bacterium]
MPLRGAATTAAVSALVAGMAAAAPSPLRAQPEGPAGVGIVQPTLDPERPLYFYPAADPGDGPGVVGPTDSVTFAESPHFVGIATAPPWFAPEGMKLDYDLLWLRAETLTRNFIEVVVNGTEPRPRFTPRTAWVDRHAVRFRPWAEFLLDVYSVETLEPAGNPLRSAPAPDAPERGPSADLPLRPLAIRGEWMRVEGADAREAGLPTGWIRWWRDGRLLVSFSLLS